MRKCEISLGGLREVAKQREQSGGLIALFGAGMDIHTNKTDMIEVRSRIMNPTFFSTRLKKLIPPYYRVFLISAIMAAVFFMGPVCVRTCAEESEDKTVYVGWYDSAYSHIDKSGNRTGLVYEYQQKVAAYTGWTYEYVEGSWGELFTMLQEGKIDLLSDVSYTRDRDGRVLYAKRPMGTESYYLYVDSDNTDITIDNLNTFNGKKIGVNKGYLQAGMLDKWIKNNHIKPVVIDLKGASDAAAIKMLTSGKLDVFVGHDTYGGRRECIPVCKIGSSDFYFAVNKDRPDLLDELNDALDRIQSENAYYNQQLFNKYIQPTKADAFLNFHEKNWLIDHEKIRVGYRDNYLPYCTSQERDGKLSGALEAYLDYASDIMRNAVISFEPIPYHSVQDALSALENGETDCVFPVNMSITDAEARGLLLTEPFMYTEVYTIVREDRQQSLPLQTSPTIAVNKGNANFDTFIKDHFSDARIKYYDKVEDCLKAVRDREVDCMLVTSFRINNVDSLRQDYHLSLLATGEAMGMSFAIRREDVDLYSIMCKIVNLIPESSMESALTSYNRTDGRVTFIAYLKDNWIQVIVIMTMIFTVILVLLFQRLRAERQALESRDLIAATELDPLTRLYNRNFFFVYANRMYEEDPDRQMDAIVLNIDRFHSVNALDGWDFGDMILKALAEEINTFASGNHGIAGRFEADRFDIYCPHEDDYQATLDRFQEILNELSQNISVRIRMGVMPCQKGVEPLPLFDRANTACNMAKTVNNRLIIYDEEMRRHELLEQRLINSLRRAVENHEFIVYYQPKYDIQSTPPRLCSAEALIRWNHPELGMLPPNMFIPLFEKNFEIGTVDQYVWEEAAGQIARWRDVYGITLPVSVNLSRKDLFDSGLEENLDKLIEKNGLERWALHLEITESAYMENEAQIIEVVEGLREKGYIIEMDDFGTGFSSLGMLSTMPIDILKLDRAFIKNLGQGEEDGDDEKDLRMVELILEIARGLKVPVVAEGVETEYQLNLLRERGCDLVQGYYFSKPLPAEEFEEKLRTEIF